MIWVGKGMAVTEGKKGPSISCFANPFLRQTPLDGQSKSSTSVHTIFIDEPAHGNRARGLLWQSIPCSCQGEASDCSCEVIVASGGKILVWVPHAGPCESSFYYCLFECFTCCVRIQSIGSAVVLLLLRVHLYLVSSFLVDFQLFT